jgi:predicted phosphodiesterase
MNKNSSTRKEPKNQPGIIYRICVIPDTHDDPRIPDKSRFTWIGRWIADCKPDYVVHLGDFLTLDSLSTHSAQDTLTARLQPQFCDDLDSLEEALEAIDFGLSGFRCRKLMVKGNHEFRADRFEDSHPNVASRGSYVSQLNAKFSTFNWTLYEYKVIVYIGGVGFVHHVCNTANKPYGGKTGMHRAANDTKFSFVQGHSHLREMVDCPKIGDNNKVTAISAGCALPQGHVEKYAEHASTGWWYGVLGLTVKDGEIMSTNFVSMIDLERKYG